MVEAGSISRNVSQELDHFFRRESGKVVAALVRRFGGSNLDLIEDVVQDVLVTALEVWPTEGMPVRPLHWMMRSSSNRMIDALRRRTFLLQNEASVAEHLRLLADADRTTHSSDELVHDDLLRMIFACAHPSLSRESQIVLILRLLFGFPLPAIAQALSVEEAAAAKRLVRAKQKFRQDASSLVLDDPTALQERLPSVLNAIYLTFAVGYNAPHTVASIREEVCDDALYLARLLIEDRRFDDCRLDALFALCLFQRARMNGDTASFEEAQKYLLRSARGSTVSTYHIEAAIAQQLSLKSPDWNEVVRLYEVLVRLSDQPSIREGLERARHMLNH